MAKRSSLTVFRAVLMALALREMRGRLNARRMGFFWFVFEPMSTILVMFGERIVLKGTEVSGLEYPVFLFTGVTPYILFKNIALQGMSAVDANRNLFAYRQIKPLDCVIARTLVECILMAAVYAGIAFVLGFIFEYDMSIAHPLQWIVTLFLGVVFSFCLGVIYCIGMEAMPNIKTFIHLMYMPLYFLSGILYPTWMLPDGVRKLMSWNPYFQIIEQLRLGVFANYPAPPGVGIGGICLFCLVALFLALALYQARRNRLVAL